MYMDYMDGMAMDKYIYAHNNMYSRSARASQLSTNNQNKCTICVCVCVRRRDPKWYVSDLAFAQLIYK